MEDLNTEQVARVLGLQPGTVRVRLHRSRLGMICAWRIDPESHGAVAGGFSRHSAGFV
jgi:hypothetical protein